MSSDVDVSKVRNEPIEKHLDDFIVFQKAKGVKERQIKDDLKMLPRLFKEAGIESLKDILRIKLDRWIVNCRTEHGRGARTINSYVDRLRAFCR